MNCATCGKGGPLVHECWGVQECLDCHDRLYKDVIIGLALNAHPRRWTQERFSEGELDQLREEVGRVVAHLHAPTA